MKGTVTIVFIGILLACSANPKALETATIAIIGTGDMGDSLGPQFAKMGYQVIYGSRNPESDKAKSLIEMTGNNARVDSQASAAAASEVVVLAIPWPAMETVAKNLDLAGKIVIDISVGWQQGEDGYPENTIQPSAAELIQKWNPQAKVVKTFATAGSTIIDDPAGAGGIVTMPVASDHRDAKEVAAKLVADMGFDPVDFGPLRMAHIIEEMQVMWLIPVVQLQPTGWVLLPSFESTVPLGPYQRVGSPCNRCWRASRYSTNTRNARALPVVGPFGQT